MHILDLIMYFVCGSILWWIMDVLWQGEITNELGGLIGVFVLLVYTIVYIVMFVVGDLNWIDVFNGTKSIHTGIKL